jgi:tetratricopeptide (TPR) repeat protein
MPSSFTIIVFSAAIAVNASVAMAQESHAGHGAADPSSPVLGTIDFPATGNSASHDAFVRGVLLMHNFHYPESAESFRKAQILDPSNVMAYWGEAMTHTHPVWNEQDTSAAHAVFAKLGSNTDARLAKARTPRERMWLGAVEALYAHGGTKAYRDTAYSLEMEKLYKADTSDVEAKAFYALSLLGLNQGDRDVDTYRRAYELIAPVFRAHPNHPGAAHYLIHAVDDPDHAGLGLDAAKAYGKIAPDAGHALHMTSHIYLALGRWDDVLDANLKAHATMPSGRLSGHGAHWIEYSLIQLGRYRDADRWLDSMVRQARTGPERLRSDSWNAAVIMAAANIVDTHRYDRKPALMRADPKYFDADSYTEAIVDLGAGYFGIGLAALQRGERDSANSILAEIRKLHTSSAGDAKKATSRGYVEVMEKTLCGYMAWKDAKLDEALRIFEDAANQEASLPMPFGPPVGIKSPRESRGELLLEMKRPADAKVEFEKALARAPLRISPLLGLARAERALGHAKESRKYYGQVRDIWHSADPDVPELAEVRAGSR